MNILCFFDFSLEFGHLLLESLFVRLKLIVELDDKVNIYLLLFKRLLHLIVLTGG